MYFKLIFNNLSDSLSIYFWFNISSTNHWIYSLILKPFFQLFLYFCANSFQQLTQFIHYRETPMKNLMNKKIINVYFTLSIFIIFIFNVEILCWQLTQKSQETICTDDFSRTFYPCLLFSQWFSMRPSTHTTLKINKKHLSSHINMTRISC